MIHPINVNIEKMNKNFWSDRKPYQVVCMILALVIAIVVIVFVSPKVGTTTSSYICVGVSLPLAYVATFNKNGLDFIAFMRAKKNNVQNGKLLCGNKLLSVSVQQQIVGSKNKKKGK